METSIPSSIKYQVKKTRKPNSRQKKVISNFVANGGNMGSAMLEAGYSEAYSRNPQKLEKCLSFKETLDLIQDQDLLEKAREIALDNEDKRSSLVAIDMLLKLKDRYPAGKLKVQEYEEELTALQSRPNVPGLPPGSQELPG